MAKDAIEYEGKVLNIDVEEVRTKLQALGAQAESRQYFRRYVFDTIPATPSRWVRLRTDSHLSTLTVKQINSDSIDGTEEWEVEVSDFEQTLTILEKIGITPRGYQENKRESFRLQGAEISIDFWPQLEPYIEIEAKNKPAVEQIAGQLGFDPKVLTGKNTQALYKEIGIDLNTVPKLSFDAEG